VKEGNVTWPPPAPKLSAAPPAAKPAAGVPVVKKGHGHDAAAEPISAAEASHPPRPARRRSR